MKQYKKYIIRKTDQFDENNFSSLSNEVDHINEKTTDIPSSFKSEIILSFLKDRTLNDDWIAANPQLTELIISNRLFTGCIEGLFDSSHDNPAFQQGLENYLKGKFTDTLTAATS